MERKVHHVTIGRPGNISITYCDGAYQTGTIETDDSYLDALKQKAIIFDYRQCEWKDAIKVSCSGPMLAIDDTDAVSWRASKYEPGAGLDACGYGSISYAPLPVFVALVRRYGVIVSNYDDYQPKAIVTDTAEQTELQL